MNKYRICWWEDNGYHDSYFHGVYFDEADGKLHSASLGATAYGGGIGFTDEYLLPTPEIVERARQCLAPLIFATLRAAEHRDVYTPGPRHVKRGWRFRLLVPHSFYLKAAGGFAKDAAGKRVKVSLPAGTVVRASGDGADFFGTTYKNGYNQPNRENTTVTALVPVGEGLQHVRVPMNKLRQDVEPMTDEWLLNRAEELSRELQFHAAFGCRAWVSDNWAAGVGLPVKW